MIKQNSLVTAIARLVKSGVLANDKAIAYEKRSYVLYELKEPAFPLMVKGANRLLEAAGYGSVDIDVLKEHYYSLNHEMKGMHDVEVATIFLKIIFSDLYLSHPVSLNTEMHLPFPNYIKEESGYSEGDVVADIAMEIDKNRMICFEVDLNTERRNKLLQKTSAYCYVQYYGNYHFNHSPVDLVYLVKDSTDKEIKKNGKSTIPADVKKVLLGQNAHFYYFILMQFAADHIGLSEKTKKPEKPLLLIDHLEALKTQGNQGAFAEVENVYRYIFDTVLYIAEHFDKDGVYHESIISDDGNRHLGEMPVTLLPHAVKVLRDMLSKVNDAGNDTYAVRKRKRMYKMILEEGSRYGITRTFYKKNTGTLLRGMVLACLDANNPVELLPFVFPELVLRDKAEAFMHNIYITCSPNEWSFSPNQKRSLLSMPLRGETTYKGSGFYEERYAAFMRNCIDVNGLTVCIENISHDIGGFLRAVEYMKMPPCLRPGTLLICLVSDDYIMANGESIHDYGLFREWESKEASPISFRGVEKTLYPDFVYGQALEDYQRLNNLRVSFYDDMAENYLPYLTGFTQDFCMLTYSEFSKALSEPVHPWIPHGYLVKRGPLPKGHIYPHIPTGILEENDLPALY